MRQFRVTVPLYVPSKNVEQGVVSGHAVYRVRANDEVSAELMVGNLREEYKRLGVDMDSWALYYRGD